MGAVSRDGEVVDGKYRIVRKLGEGGMGAVYAGEHMRLKKAVAIKILHAGASAHEEMAERFEREAQAASRIGSDHIAEVFDIGATASGERFMVMEYLDGESLRTRLRRTKRMPTVELADFASQLLEGLRCAHQAGIVHRDLKPDNVFLVKEKSGRRDFVKLLDFGISKFTAVGDSGSVTRTGTVMGSPNYMSPEHVQASHEVDARSDIFSVGVVLFEALTGKVPRKAGTFAEILFKVVYEPIPDPRTVDPEVDPDLAVIVMRACAHRKELRYQTAEEFKAAVDAVLVARRGPLSDPGMRTMALPPGGLVPAAPSSNPGAASHPQFGSGGYPLPGSVSQPQLLQPGPSPHGGSLPNLGGSQPSFASASHPSLGLGAQLPAATPSAPSQPGFGPVPPPSIGGGSQPSFASGSQPSFASGSQPSFGSSSNASPGSTSQPSFGSPFSVTNQATGDAPVPRRRRLGVVIAVAAAAACGVLIALAVGSGSLSGSPVAAAPPSSAPVAPTATASPTSGPTPAAAATSEAPSASSASATDATATAAAASASATVAPGQKGPPRGPRPGGGSGKSPSTSSGISAGY